MGLMNSALNIGRSAISSYQSALSVVGNNIANAADPDYTRQRAVLDPLTGSALAEGIQPGGGVAVTSLQRIINEALEARLRLALGETKSFQAESEILTQIEQSFSELTDHDISSMLSSLFNSFQDVQNNPTDLGLRAVTVGQADALAGSLRARRAGLVELVDAINQQVIATVRQADDLAEQIANLNVKIVEAEAGGHTASALRDSRDALLRELGERIEITVRAQESGSVSVFVGNETLVQFGNSRGLTTRQVVDGQMVRQDVYFVDSSGQAEVRGGVLQGLLRARDEHLTNVIEQLDQLASGLITAINQVHANGQGVGGYSLLTGSTALDDADVPLNDASAGLAVPLVSGSFFVAVTDGASGQTVSYQIDIDLDGRDGDDTTLNSLVEQINSTVANVSAEVTVNRALSLSAAPGYTFTFGHDGSGARDDTSNVLTALGVNTFYEGHNASDIAVNARIASEPKLLAAAAAYFEGDGDNAGLLADAGNNANATLGGIGVFDFYNQTIGQLGVTSAATQTRVQNAEAVLASLQQQRASISGVNLDEEAVELLRYEKAFQGSARFTSVIDRLIAEMLAMVR